ncbi:hypothetical protein ACUXG4_005521 [Cupriavidus metallidurans]
MIADWACRAAAFLAALGVPAAGHANIAANDGAGRPQPLALPGQRSLVPDATADPSAALDPASRGGWWLAGSRRLILDACSRKLWHSSGSIADSRPNLASGGICPNRESRYVFVQPPRSCLPRMKSATPAHPQSLTSRKQIFHVREGQTLPLLGDFWRSIAHMFSASKSPLSNKCYTFHDFNARSPSQRQFMTAHQALTDLKAMAESGRSRSDAHGEAAAVSDRPVPRRFDASVVDPLVLERQRDCRVVTCRPGDEALRCRQLGRPARHDRD